jgi:hypothetical protein
MARLSTWAAPSWEDHFARVDPWLEACARAAPRALADQALAHADRGVPAALTPQSLPRG